MKRWHAEYAWLGDRFVPDVVIESEDSVFTSVTPEVTASPPGALRLPGLTLPGLANAHSHAFHRAMRGRTQADRGSFWTWREHMYAVASRLTPESYLRLARATYAEMALAGITCVGEFHYLHHGPDGEPYAEPNVMADALFEAAAQAGIRITLLDTLYLAGGVGRELEGPQLRFGDGTAEAWAERVDAIVPPAHARLGCAIHSVRAVPPTAMGPVVSWSQRNGAPLHVHLSEQRAENEACLANYRRTPTRLLDQAGVLGPRTTVVHATHLTNGNIRDLGGARVFVCMCPTTERDLADGIGPARALAKRGATLTLGTDSHAMIDMFEEARAVELDERLRSEERGHWTAAELLGAATAAGHASLGWPDAGVIAAGAQADLVTLDRSSVRLAGGGRHTATESVIFAATASDVRYVVSGGVEVVMDGRHLLVTDVAGELSQAIAEVLGD
ncbi:MAG: formimidoylglutamate deiminase [Sporichthyaceae bacterium]|nr:formimidoylglutamate deiminase [Sporichthyaceae bacterium]